MNKKIHQIFISANNDPLSSQLEKNVKQIQLLYPEYEYNFYDNQKIKDILTNNFSDKIVQAYLDLKPYAFKADLARMCLLYLYAGYYFDLGINVVNKIEFDNHEIVMVLGETDQHHSNLTLIENNFCFVKNKKNKIIKSIIDEIANNVYNLNYGIHPLDVSGPLAIGRIVDTNNKNITFCSVKKDFQFLTHEERSQDMTGERKIAYYQDKIFYYFKLNSLSSDLTQLGGLGTNNYSSMWYQNQVYNIRFSYIVFTKHDISYNQTVVENLCIDSIIQNLQANDQILVIGKTSHIKHKDQKNIWLIETADIALSDKYDIAIKISLGNVIILLNSYMLLPNFFNNNILNYINENKSFDTFNTKIYLPDGSRFLDRAIHSFELESNYKLVEYNYIKDNLLYYPGIIIMKKSIAKEIRFSEQIWSENNLGVTLSKQLNNLGYQINIDLNNLVFLYDKTIKSIDLKKNKEKKITFNRLLLQLKQKIKKE